MGQQVSSDERKGEQQIPYTKYSLPKERASLYEEPSGKQQGGGITVVHPSPEAGLRVNVPIELQKLEKVHRFWPILKSSLESIPPQEKITDGVDYKHILKMCQRYQEHLGEAAKIVGHEQRALASRLRDIEMFSAGVAQQIIRRDEKMERVGQHLQRVDEVAKIMDEINTSLAHCIPLLHFLNGQLPEDLRLDTFRLRELPQDQTAEDTADDDGAQQLGHRPTGQAIVREEDPDGHGIEEVGRAREDGERKPAEGGRLVEKKEEEGVEEEEEEEEDERRIESEDMERTEGSPVEHGSGTEMKEEVKDEEEVVGAEKTDTKDVAVDNGGEELT